MKTQENMIPIKELFDVKLAALEKSIAVAANLMDTRLHAMNEFRLQLRDQTLTFLTKNEHQIMVDSLHKDIKFITDDIRVLRDSKSLLEGKASWVICTFWAITGSCAVTRPCWRTWSG